MRYGWKAPASPQEKGATTLGGITLPNTFAPAPSTQPVVRQSPMPVLTWSPNIVPRNCIPVSRVPSGVQSCTSP